MFPRPNPYSRALAAWLLAAVILCPFVRFAEAQDTLTGAFEGTVTDARTGQPVARARVEFVNQQTGVGVTKLTDSRGRFYQGLLAPGTYTIRASAAGYESGETVQRLAGMRTGEVVPVPIVLEPSPAGSAQPTPATATPTPQTSTTPPTTPSTTPQPSPTAASTTPTPAVATPTPPVAAPTSTPQRTAAETDVRAGVNAKDASRGGVFNDEEVQGLPLGATALTRTFDELALYLPDVALPPQTLGGGSGPGVGAGVGTSGQFSANGLRSRANNFTVDGSDNNDEDIGVRRQGFFSLVPQPVESIKEYQVITLLAPAQYGRNIGAQVNAISRSGGSEHHGTLFGLFNSSQLNARNHFDTAFGSDVTPLVSGTQPVVLASSVAFNPQTLNFNVISGRPLRVQNGSGGEDSSTLTQGGFVMGGPVVPQKLFYFVSAEGQVLNASKEESFVVPTVAQRGAFGTGATGVFQDPFTNQPIFTFPSTLGGDAVFSLYPLPNNPRGVYGDNTYTQGLPASARGLILSGKLDYMFRRGERAQQLTGRYNFTNDWRELPATGGALFSTLKPRVRTQNLSLFLNSELSGSGSTTQLFNQLRLSYGRTRLRFDEVRDTQHMVASRDFPDEPFLLNAPLYTNLTLPHFDAVNNRLVANTGPVVYFDNHATVEDVLGPLGQVTMAGFSPVGVDVFNFPQKRVNNTYQFADQLTLRRGTHNLIFGTDNRRTELNSILPRNFRPLLSFQGEPRLGVGSGGLQILDEFVDASTLAAASAASGFFQTLTTGSDAGVNLRFYQLDYFVQDEWRVRPNLSLSLGLRYEFNTPVRETQRRIEGTFDDNSLAPVPGLPTFVAGRKRIYDPDTNNFAPRIGVAYAPHWFGEPGATLLRVGYGRFNDITLGAVVSQSRNVFPTFLTVNTAGGFGNLLFPLVPLSLLNPSDPNLGLVVPGTLNLLNPQTPLAQHVANINLLARAGGVLPSASGVEATLPARRQQSPDAHQYSFTFEQRFGRDTFLSVAYIGTQASHLPRFTTPNLGTNAVTLLRSFDFDLQGEGRFVPEFFGIAIQPGTRLSRGGAAGQGQVFTGGRPVSGVGGIQFFETTASSRYDAFQLELRGRVRSRLLYRLGYTLSKSTDDVSDVFDLAGAPALPQNSLTFAGERGPSNFDARHRFTYHAVYGFPRFRNAAARLVFDNLQIAGTGRFQTGQPFTVNSIFDVNLDGNLTDRLDTTGGIVSTGDRSQPVRLTTNDLASLRARVGQDGSVGRNTFRAGSYLDMNLAFIKSFRVGESKSLVFRTEIFNFLDRANFGVPVRQLEAVGFGRATSTLTPGRRVQFHLKFSF
ncbi:MAG TPA: TonB-dependent receptor [Pyrinomonadaceae bacterium]|nr:TonB-dependent receptor [Pyrinomonadaceae bacterium]